MALVKSIFRERAFVAGVMQLLQQAQPKFLESSTFLGDQTVDPFLNVPIRAELCHAAFPPLEPSDGSRDLGWLWARNPAGNKKGIAKSSQSLEIIWLGERGSNPHSRSQSPLSFH
jgi:hypothetical protein